MQLLRRPSCAAPLALRMLVVGATITLAACSTMQPWVNVPIAPQSPTPSVSAVAIPAPPGQTPSIVAAIALSGGGARAAAFGLGVLTELKATQFEWQGRKTSILDEVGLVSGVSGGSVLAAYYAAFGDETFIRFERDFLMADFQSSQIGRAFAPATLNRMTSPRYGRSNVLDEKLERLYRGTTFAELLTRRGGPRLLVTATDLTTGAPFEFTPEQFALICSDLNSVPLSVAVTASSIVPLLLSPVTLKNYAGSCEQSKQVAEAAMDDRNVEARLRQASMQRYLDVQNRPFLHLVDGGLVDNLGVRGLLVRTVAGGSLDASFQHLPAGSVRKIMLISVNSERDTAERIDSDDRVPNLLQVLDALAIGARARATQETIAAMKDSARRWAYELNAVRGTQGSPFAADAEIHVISVNLRDLKDEKTRNALLQVPTALTILPIQVLQLEEAGRAVLRESPQFQQLRDGLVAPPRD